MPNIKSYIKKADAISEKAEKYISKCRNEIGMKIRKEVLLPFCRKHNLELCINIYGNTFIQSDGTVIDCDDIHKYVKDPMAETIHEYLKIYFMGDYIFDFGMGFDISENDLTNV